MTAAPATIVGACRLRLAWAVAALALLGLGSPPTMAGPLDDPRNDAFYTPPTRCRRDRTAP